MKETLQAFLPSLFSLNDKIAIITGGTGVLGSAMARGLAQAGAKVGILGRRKEQAESVVADIKAAGGEAIALSADVLQKDQLQGVRDAVIAQWGRVDILVNAAGGNAPDATVPPDKTVFDMPLEALRFVLDLNLVGTLLPSQVFGAVMAAQRPLTRVVAYAAAKAAVDNFTQWLAVELMRKYGPGLRVNAIAPGFFIGEQNRRLLLNEDNTLTARGQTIIDHTPAGRFGEPDELIGTLIWLCSPAAKFVNGVVVPVDGGFNAFGGV
jgi:NAD(P)-dependent dehydrogenase (short-subunit alcohol dehydrogenase family)